MPQSGWSDGWCTAAYQLLSSSSVTTVALPVGLAIAVVPLMAAATHPLGPMWYQHWLHSVDTPEPRVEGFTAPGYESARDVFRKLIMDGMEDNAQVCAYADGEVVLDLVGSFDRNRLHSRQYSASSIQNVFSSSKAITSILMAMLVDKAYISYDTPIADVWAEFSDHDKEDVTLEDLMRHETGLQKFSFVLSAQQHLHRDRLKETTHVGDSIAASQKNPGHLIDTGPGAVSSDQMRSHPDFAGSMTIQDVEARVKSRAYHAITRGWIENEICMRVDPQGRTLGELLRDWLAHPLGLEGELTLGEETIEHADRIAPLIKISPRWILSQMLRIFNRRVELKSLVMAILLRNLPLMYKIGGLLFGPRFSRPSLVAGATDTHEQHMHPADLFNKPQVRAAEIPSANCHASARAMAKLAAFMAGNGALGDKTIMSAHTAQVAQGNPTEKQDTLLRATTKFTTGGWAVFDTDFGCNRQGSIGWFGIGGSVLMWHPELKVGFAYANNLFGASVYNHNSYLVQQEVLNCKKTLRDSSALPLEN